MFKNKKPIFIIFTVVLAVALFAGCGNKTQLDKARDRIVSIGEQFLDYEITIDEASEQLESVVVPSTEGMGGSRLDGDRNYLDYLILKTKTANVFFDEIQEEVQHIKEFDYNKFDTY